MTTAESERKGSGHLNAAQWDKEGWMLSAENELINGLVDFNSKVIVKFSHMTE